MKNRISIKKNIVVDESMPGVAKLFGDIANIRYYAGRKINPMDLKHADGLICRSITEVGEHLLVNSNVSFVGTATIGTDHLDIPWLEARGIEWSNAVGCNAAAVTQYVLSAVAFWCSKIDKDFNKLSFGIVGTGNVGSELVKCLDKLGVGYKLYDPPMALERGARAYSSFDELMNCDVVTLHVPLIKGGRYPTLHMIGQKELSKLTNSQLLINASRGRIIDNTALCEYLNGEGSANVVLDVFENEPNISQELVSKCLIATPHIAGHTLEGKLRGTWMIYEAYCDHFGLEKTQSESILYPKNNEIEILGQSLTRNLLAMYDIEQDSNQLKNKSGSELSHYFDQLRKNATLLSNGKVRRDYSGWNVKSDNKDFAKLFL